MQMLLDPIVMEFSNVDMMKIENNMDLFLNFGFEIELFGNNHIMVREYQLYLEHQKVKSLYFK